MTINEWLNEMALAGFTGKFEASNSEMKVTGELVKIDDVVKVKVMQKTDTKRTEG